VSLELFVLCTKTQKVTHIVFVIQEFEEAFIAHFIVKLSNGTYIDPTYGNITTCLDLHKVHEYKTTNFKAVKALLCGKDYIYNLLPWYLKLFTSPKEF